MNETEEVIERLFRKINSLLDIYKGNMELEEAIIKGMKKKVSAMRKEYKDSPVYAYGFETYD